MLSVLQTVDTPLVSGNRGRRPKPVPFLHPSGEPTLIRLGSPPAEATPLDEDPLQPLHSNPEPTPTQRRHGPPLPQRDRHRLESVIGMSELLIGIVGIRTVPKRIHMRLDATWRRRPYHDQLEHLSGR